LIFSFYNKKNDAADNQRNQMYEREIFHFDLLFLL
jgi:hypothetical protein